MTDLHFAISILTAEPEPLYWGMPLPLMLGLVTLAGGVLAALITAVSKRWRTPADDREDKKIGIEADERLLKRFEDMLEDRDDQISELRNELKGLAKRVDEVLSENHALIDWIYVAVRVVRELNGIHMLPPPPKGVHIADHPSSMLQEQDTKP